MTGPRPEPAADEHLARRQPTRIETICLSLVAIVLVALSFFGLVSVAYPDPNRWQDDASAATSLIEMRELKAADLVRTGGVWGSAPNNPF